MIVTLRELLSGLAFDGSDDVILYDGNYYIGFKGELKNAPKEYLEYFVKHISFGECTEIHLV